MADDETLSELLTQVAALRAALVEQQATISDLRTAVRELHAASPATPTAEPLATMQPVASSAPVSVQSAQPRRARKGTSRRGLLRGAAAATAAAAVATVTVGASEQAHAAPLTTGGNFILGQTNDANAPTTLTNTSGSSTGYLLNIDNTGSGSGMQGLHANSLNGVAIIGNDNGTGWGVQGQSYSGVGVYGEADTGNGVVGTSGNSIAIAGISSQGIDIKCSGTGRFAQKLQLQAGPPVQGTYTAGESIRDINGEMWLCMANGTPGTWAQVAHLSPGFTYSGTISYLSKPIRIFDSRSGASDARFTPGTPCTSSAATTVQIAGVSYNGITMPHILGGAIGNVTVVNEQGSGYLELVPSGAGFTGAANLAFAPGQIISNACNVGLNSTGALDIIIGGAATDVIIDLFAIVA